MSYRIAIAVVISFAVLSMGCRPQACDNARPIIERVSTALAEERLDAASPGLDELSQLLGEEGGYLEGFAGFSAELHEVIEAQHNLDRLSERERDATQRRLLPLIGGWQQEAKAVKRRCGSYLL